MVEWAMLFAAGLLSAALIALMLAPVLWRRAVYLTAKRIRSVTPLSLADIQADKDKLRAQFALSTRKLEVKLDKLNAELTDYRIELARAQERGASFEADAHAKTSIIAELEAEIGDVKERLLRAEELASGHLRNLQESNRKLTELRKALDDERAHSNEVSLIADEQKVELAALKTRLATSRPLNGRSLNGSSTAMQDIDTRHVKAANDPAADKTATDAPAGVREKAPEAPAEDSAAAPAPAATQAASGSADVVDLASSRLARAEQSQQQAVKASEEAMDKLRGAVEALKVDLAAARGEKSAAELRETLNDLAARVARTAAEASDHNGELAKILKPSPVQHNGGKSDSKAEPPVGLSKVSSVLASRSTRSLMDRIKGLDTTTPASN